MSQIPFSDSRSNSYYNSDNNNLTIISFSQNPLKRIRDSKYRNIKYIIFDLAFLNK